MVDLDKLTIASSQKFLASGELSARGLTEFYQEKIRRLNPGINAYLEVFDDALEQAEVCDRQLAGGKRSPLLGVPLAIKDNILIKGRIASACSRMLENYRAGYDATVIDRLRRAGAVFLGRTNMDEFAMGSSTENSAFGPTRNPFDPSRTAGGSSGGSAAAVGAGLCLAALGSDTAGSIRQPASFCGVVGLKPTYGAVSRFGLIALASSLDQIGPLAKTVADAEIIFRAIAGPDPNDSTSQSASPPAPPEKFRLGVPRRFLTKGVDAAVSENFESSLTRLRDLGCEIKTVDLATLRYSLACYYVIMPAEASTNLARYDGVRYGFYQGGDDLFDDYLKTRGLGFGREPRRRLILGAFVLSAGYYDAYYRRAVAVRRLLSEDFRRAFRETDLVVLPTAPTTAFPLGEKSDDPLKMYLSDIFTAAANLAGLPAISIPSGRDRAGLPFGLQFIAPAFGEDRLFALAKKFEAAYVA